MANGGSGFRGKLSSADRATLITLAGHRVWVTTEGIHMVEYYRLQPHVIEGTCRVKTEVKPNGRDPLLIQGK